MQDGGFRPGTAEAAAPPLQAQRQAEAGAKEALPVVLVSSDMSPEEFKRHVAALPPQWLAVRYERPGPRPCGAAVEC